MHNKRYRKTGKYEFGDIDDMVTVIVAKKVIFPKREIMNKYEARWNKAKTLALDILKRQKEATKKFGKKTLLVKDGLLVEGNLIVDDWQIYIQTLSPKCHCAIFENNPDMDHGSHTPVKEIVKMFSGYEIYTPFKKGKK